MTTDTFTYACQRCGGTVNVECGDGQPHDCGNLTIEVTELLIRHENTILVRLERDWTGDERWVLTVDRARPASGFVNPQRIDGWEQARAEAVKLARDVYEHETANQDAARRLTQRWPRWNPPAASSDGELEK